MNFIMNVREKLYDYTDNNLAWLFFISSLAFYIALGIGPLPGPDPILFNEMMSHTDAGPVAWGVVGLLSMALAVIGIQTYNEKAIKVFSAIQLSLWVYACIAFITAGLYTLAIGVALVHVLFWVWNYADRKTVRNRRAKQMVGLTR